MLECCRPCTAVRFRPCKGVSVPQDVAAADEDAADGPHPSAMSPASDASEEPPMPRTCGGGGAVESCICNEPLRRRQLAPVEHKNTDRLPQAWDWCSICCDMNASYLP
jgi:hypothetical protein